MRRREPHRHPHWAVTHPGSQVHHERQKRRSENPTAVVAACTPSNKPSHGCRRPVEVARAPPPSSLDTRGLRTQGKPHNETASVPPPSSLDTWSLWTQGKPHDEAARPPPPSSPYRHPPQPKHEVARCPPPFSVRAPTPVRRVEQKGGPNGDGGNSSS